MHVPPDLEAGVYANFLHVWSTHHEFTLDFAATLPPRSVTRDGDQFLYLPSRVVARVKLPVNLLPQSVDLLQQVLHAHRERSETGDVSTDDSPDSFIPMWEPTAE